ncbi:MAG: hypothetical protein KDA86_19665 [Planctomycetaceae bacterium]|nr:hypothetical protein [Planctomycetaceae bacterium]
MQRTSRTPKYGRHKSTGQARVLIDGQHVYLGPYDSPESKRRYKEVIDHWRQRQQGALFSALTIAQLGLLYLEFATTYYQKDGTPTSQLPTIQSALKPLMRLFRSVEVANFGPVKLRRYRDALVEAELSRETCNSYVGKVVRMIRWAVSQELCASHVLTALESVEV